MKIYDVFQERWITPNEVDSIAPPERYIYVDVPNLEPKYDFELQNKHNSLDIAIVALDYCIVDECEHCPYFNKGCIDVLLKDIKYHLEQYKRSINE